MTFPCSHIRLFLACVLLGAPAWGAAPSALDEAVRAMNEGVAEVAVVKLEALLSAPAGLAPELRREAKTHLAEALLSAGRPADALKAVTDPEVKAPLLEGRILAAAGNWEAALTRFSLPEFARDPKAVMGKAECLHALNRPAEAIDALRSLEGTGAPASMALRLAELYLEQSQSREGAAVLSGLQSPLNERERKWKAYLEAQVLIAEEKKSEAFRRLEDLQRDPSHASNGLIVGATLGMTSTRSELTSLTAADDIIEQFIWKHPESPSLALLFRKLDTLYDGEGTPSFAELQKWAQRDPAIRAGFACYYLARALDREGKSERALESLKAIETRFRNHPILPEALLLRGRLLAGVGKFDEAQKSLEDALRAAPPGELRGEIEMASARVYFQAGEFVLAATVYRAAGEHAPAFAETARFNAALAWLHQGNYTRFGQEYQEFSRLYPRSTLRPDLILEEGLLRARQSDPKAAEALRQFISDFPENPRVADARLALAELHYAAGEPDKSNRYLRVVNESPAPVKTVEQADFLAIFVADAATPPNDEKVIALCRDYIEHHPEPSNGVGEDRLAKVRMKLGQVYFRDGDFASAQTQFETLAQENPASPLVEPALFLAGQSATQRMSGIDPAIDLFTKVASLNGPFKLHARLQLAELQKRLGKEADAVRLYDDILRSNPQEEVKWAAMAGKADNLAAMGAKGEKGDKDNKGDKALNEQALAAYEQLAAEPGISATLLHRALYSKGRCLELLDRPDEALAAYYQVVDSGSANPREYFWFYKAGFDACRLSEKREQWKSAIAIYQKMAAVEGPRAEEAKACLTRLRLEHFIWESGK